MAGSYQPRRPRGVTAGSGGQLGGPRDRATLGRARRAEPSSRGMSPPARDSFAVDAGRGHVGDGGAAEGVRSRTRSGSRRRRAPALRAPREPARPCAPHVNWARPRGLYPTHGGRGHGRRSGRPPCTPVRAGAPPPPGSGSLPSLSAGPEARRSAKAGHFRGESSKRRFQAPAGCTRGIEGAAGEAEGRAQPGRGAGRPAALPPPLGRLVRSAALST